MTRVLPLPAPARISRGPSVQATASRCGGLRPLRKSMASGTLRILPCVALALLRAGPRGHPRLSGTQAKLNVSSAGSFRLRRFLFLSLYSLMALAAALLAIRLVVGPFRSGLVTVNSPANAGAAVAVSFVLLALIAAKNPAGFVAVSFVLLALIAAKNPAGPLPESCTARALPRPVWVDLTVLVAATALAFWRNLGSPFVYDDYGHIVQTSHATWRILADAFQREPGGHGLFFRPVGFISYWLDYRWAGGHAVRWHLWSLAAYAANTCLVYLLVRRLGVRRVGALVAALLFALHGS